MVQEKSGESLVYNQPAGHVEVGEGLIAAAVRETFEETGWQVRVECLIGIYSHVHKANGIHYLHFYKSGISWFSLSQKRQMKFFSPECIFLSIYHLSNRKSQKLLFETF